MEGKRSVKRNIPNESDFDRVVKELKTQIDNNEKGKSDE